MSTVMKKLLQSLVFLVTACRGDGQLDQPDSNGYQLPDVLPRLEEIPRSPYAAETWMYLDIKKHGYRMKIRRDGDTGPNQTDSRAKVVTWIQQWDDEAETANNSIYFKLWTGAIEIAHVRQFERGGRPELPGPGHLNALEMQALSLSGRVWCAISGPNPELWIGFTLAEMERHAARIDPEEARLALEREIYGCALD